MSGMSLIGKRLLSSSQVLQSHIGSASIFITEGTSLTTETLALPTIIRKGNKVLTLSQYVTVKGPKGEISMKIPDFVELKKDPKGTIVDIAVNNSGDKIQRSMWGTIRSLLQNHVTGVNEGHLATLKFVGTGYRASLERDGTFVNVKVGASITQGLTIPEGITVKSPTQTSLIIEGCDKQQVLLFAANLRKFHPPEPYKGKGIYVNSEAIKIKDKKIK